MRKLNTYLFCSQKYFLDNKYQNLHIETLNEHGSLRKVSKFFSEMNIELAYIKSRFANVWTQQKIYSLDISNRRQSPEVLAKLKQKFNEEGIKMEEQPPIKVAWFPTCEEQLNKIGQELLDVKDEVNRDHPQFKDEEYRKRRDYIAQVALAYKMGQKIPDIPYTKQETVLWRNIYKKLRGYHKTSMSERFNSQIEKLQNQLLISERIPQLSELNSYLKNKTGFQIKPTHGILSQREFLNAFAFRVFCSTQYIRHTQTPQYTPEPDIVHEIIGHVPMFADPAVAELSQEIGLLSLGATDEQIAQLGSLYWFTLQFGACQEGDKTLGYGAGIASSLGEIQHFTSSKAQFKPFDPLTDCKESYPIQTVQDCYRVTKSFDQSLKDLQNYGYSIMKPITTFYNFQNRTVEYDRNIEAVYTEDKGPKF